MWRYLCWVSPLVCPRPKWQCVATRGRGAHGCGGALPQCGIRESALRATWWSYCAMHCCWIHQGTGGWAELHTALNNHAVGQHPVGLPPSTHFRFAGRSHRRCKGERASTPHCLAGADTTHRRTCATFFFIPFWAIVGVITTIILSDEIFIWIVSMDSTLLRAFPSNKTRYFCFLFH